MRSFFLLSLLSLVVIGSAGCASDDPPSPQAHVSTIPWNRPEKWESQGPMGGMMPGSQ